MKKFFLFLFFLISFFDFVFGYDPSNSACSYYSWASDYFIGNVTIEESIPYSVKQSLFLGFHDKLYTSLSGTVISYRFYLLTWFVDVGFDIFSEYGYAFLSAGDKVYFFNCSASADYPLDFFLYKLRVQFIDSSDTYLLFNLSIYRKDTNDLVYEGSNRFYIDFPLNNGVDVKNYNLWNWLLYLWDRKYFFSWYILDWKYYLVDFSGSKYFSFDLYTKNVPFPFMNINYQFSTSESFYSHKFVFVNSWLELDWLNFVFVKNNSSYSDSDIFSYSGGYSFGNSFNLFSSGFNFFSCPFSWSMFGTFNFSLHSLFPNFFDNIVGSIIPDFISNFDFLSFITCPVNWVSKAYHDSKDFIPFSSLFVSPSSLNRNLYVSVSDDQFSKFNFLLNIVLIGVLFISLFIYLIR